MKKHLAAIAGLLILMTLAGCGAQRTSDAPQLLEPVDVRVDVAQAKIDTIYNITSYDGEIVPHVEELQFVTDGIIDEVKVSLGDIVEKDQVLVTLNETATREQIAAITSKTDMKILVTLSCTMCPDLVVAAQRIAAANPNVTAHVYDIRHFETLKNQYNVMSVPCLVVNDGEAVSFGKKNILYMMKI